MISGRSVLAIIPARGGSKGIKRKNLVEVGGVPLLARTVWQAHESRYIDRTILSSDDAEIRKVGAGYGCEVPFVRPDHLASDTASSMDVVRHAISELKKPFDYLALLQVTSPLRLSSDIDRCIELCVETSAPCCVSVTKADKSPYYMYNLDENSVLTPIVTGGPTLAHRRQDQPLAYVPNGAVYVAEVEWLLNQDHFLSSETVGYEMPIERSLDIDTEVDLAYLKLILATT